MSITPSILYVNTPIICSFNITDVDTGDSLSANVTWYQNSSGSFAQVTTYDTKVSCNNGEWCYTDTIVPITHANHDEGVAWICSVMAYDETVWTSDSNSSEEVIYNNAPNITAISITPTSPNITSDLSCNATINDNENTTVTVEYY